MGKKNKPRKTNKKSKFLNAKIFLKEIETVSHNGNVRVQTDQSSQIVRIKRDESTQYIAERFFARWKNAQTALGELTAHLEDIGTGKSLSGFSIIDYQEGETGYTFLLSVDQGRIKHYGILAANIPFIAISHHALVRIRERLAMEEEIRKIYKPDDVKMDNVDRQMAASFGFTLISRFTHSGLHKIIEPVVRKAAQDKPEAAIYVPQGTFCVVPATRNSDMSLPTYWVISTFIGAGTFGDHERPKREIDKSFHAKILNHHQIAEQNERAEYSSADEQIHQQVQGSLAEEPSVVENVKVVSEATTQDIGDKEMTSMPQKDRDNHSLNLFLFVSLSAVRCARSGIDLKISESMFLEAKSGSEEFSKDYLTFIGRWVFGYVYSSFTISNGSLTAPLASCEKALYRTYLLLKGVSNLSGKTKKLDVSSSVMSLFCIEQFEQLSYDELNRIFSAQRPSGAASKQFFESSKIAKVEPKRIKAKLSTGANEKAVTEVPKFKISEASELPQLAAPLSKEVEKTATIYDIRSLKDQSAQSHVSFFSEARMFRSDLNVVRMRADTTRRSRNPYSPHKDNPFNSLYLSDEIVLSKILGELDEKRAISPEEQARARRELEVVYTSLKSSLLGLIEDSSYGSVVTLAFGKGEDFSKHSLFYIENSLKNTLETFMKDYDLARDTRELPPLSFSVKDRQVSISCSRK
ncbi:MAG: hypothetical protein EOP06_01995 [Proteobacteria bacterium]|nr:MAG: hypothetical protein EOP06_01995 [Pseudomonadota bacterium]